LSPGYRGITNEGREILDFLPGTVGGYPITPEAGSIEALVGAARALRALHDASASFTRESGDRWMLPARAPVEVICHGDFGPHNCVLEGTDVVGIIDFDTAHPGPRVWDVGCSVYRWAPMSAPSNPDVAGTVQDQARRVQIFLAEYGLDDEERARLVDTMVSRLSALVGFMRDQSAAGNEAYARHVERGDDVLYETDIGYILENRGSFEEIDS
jgi:Ser/Thr protein kinase RdoA (MazF antagonist)